MLTNRDSEDKIHESREENAENPRLSLSIRTILKHRSTNQFLPLLHTKAEADAEH